CRRGPTFRAANSPWHAFLVQRSNDLRHRFASRVGGENAKDDRGLLRFDLHSIAIRPWPALLVDPHLAHRHRSVAECALTHEEPAFLLAHLTAERLLLQVAELELVEDPTDLDGEGGLLVRAVKPVADGDNADALEAQLGDDREHEVVVACQP